MGDDRDLFEQAMQGVEPLPVEDRAAVPRPRRPGGKRAPSQGRRGRFRIERAGERLAALAAGADRARLAALEKGEIAVELHLDLHRMGEEVARGEVELALRRAVDGGLACLAIIHGRGLRSPAGPVLKQAVPGWLAGSPLAPHILAFATAPPQLGGEGVTLVLLRRRRRSRAAPP